MLCVVIATSNHLSNVLALQELPDVNPSIYFREKADGIGVYSATKVYFVVIEMTEKFNITYFIFK